MTKYKKTLIQLRINEIQVKKPILLDITIIEKESVVDIDNYILNRLEANIDELFEPYTDPEDFTNVFRIITISEIKNRIKNKKLSKLEVLLMCPDAYIELL